MRVNWKRLLLAVYRLEEGQQEVLSRLDRMEGRGVEGAAPYGKNAQSEWIQNGIDNILSYQVGKKKEEGEE